MKTKVSKFPAYWKYDFVDAQEMAKKHPDTFGCPSQNELSAIKVGYNVKVSYNNERFWVLVKKINGDEVVGQVDNDLVLEQPFSCGNLIRFEKRHVYDILNKGTK